MPVVAVGALGVVLAALLAALLIYGLTLLAKAVGYLVPDWHIPGLGNIRQAIINGANAAFQAAVGWFDQAVAPVGNWLRAPFHVVEYLIDEAINVAQSIYNALNFLSGFVVYAYHAAVKYAAEVATGVARMAIRFFERAEADIRAAYRAAVTYAAQVATGVARMAIRLFGQAEALARSLYHAAVTYAAEVATGVARMAIRLFERAEADAAAAAASAAALAHRLFTIAERDAAAAAARAEATAKAYASTAVAAASKVIATDITHPVEQAWVDIRDEVTAIEQVLASDLPDIRALVRRLDIARVGDIAAATGALAAVDVLVLRYLRECGIPNCRNLHGFGNDLAKLFAVVEGAAFFEFLTAMVRDPAGTSAEVVDITAPIITDTADTFTALMGL